MLTSVANALPTINRQASSGELPQAITDLIDNKLYLPRHKKLQRLYGDQVLLKLAELAQTKAKPSHWYAKVTSVANWDQTLKMVKKLINAARRAAEAMKKLGAAPSWTKWYIKEAFRSTEASFAYRVEQACKGKTPVRLFAHLSKEGNRNGR